jgi:UDP-N-acetylglucosamine 4-epimerase
MNDKQPTVHGDGLQSRDFTFVENAVSANLLACEAPAEKSPESFLTLPVVRAIR